MGVKISVSEDGNYIIGKVDEPLTHEIAKLLTIEYTKLIKELGIYLILNDLRGARNEMNTLQDYKYAYSETNELMLPRNIRAAILADPGDSSFDFQMTVALNAGYEVKVFHILELAINWLLEKK